MCGTSVASNKQVAKRKPASMIRLTRQRLQADACTLQAGIVRLANRAAAYRSRNRGIRFHASFCRAQPATDTRGVKVTNRKCECVGCVMRFRNSRKGEQHAPLFLDLPFFGVAISGDGLLDEPRSVLANF